LPRLEAKAIWARSIVERARWSSSSDPDLRGHQSEGRVGGAGLVVGLRRGKRAFRLWRARASARRHALGMRRRPPTHHAPGRARERSSSRRRLVQPRRRWGRCKHGDRDRPQDRSRRQARCTACRSSGAAPDTRRADQRVTKVTRTPIVSSPWCRLRLDSDSAPPGAATTSTGSRPARPPRPTRAAGYWPGAPRAWGESCLRSAPTAPGRPANRTRPPVPPASTRAATPITPAGYPASQRPCAPAPAHPTNPQTPSPAARGITITQTLDNQLLNPVSSSSAPASPTPARPTPNSRRGHEHQRPAPSPVKPLRVINHTQKRCPRHPDSRSAPPARPETGPAPSPRLAECHPARPAEGQAAGPGDPG